MEDVGAISPRTKQASMNALAEISGVHATTIQRIVYGRAIGPRGVAKDTIEKLAEALNKKPSTIAKWVGQQWAADDPYVAPPEASILGPRQRKAVDEMIMALVELQKRVPVKGEGKEEDDDEPELATSAGSHKRR
ncbi:hypothetical protein CJ179_38840 [Rhodococcus sp. ACS1]|nr:hypothetical protein CJ179_38840 [Rhodococcus sp. ACS1]